MITVDVLKRSKETPGAVLCSMEVFRDNDSLANAIARWIIDDNVRRFTVKFIKRR